MCRDHIDYIVDIRSNSRFDVDLERYGTVSPDTREGGRRRLLAERASP